jgi:sulfite dehydrogenase
MTKLIGLFAAGAAMSALLPGPAAGPRTFALPPETAVYRASDLPGYQLVQRNCVGCHSAQYVATQPPALPRTYWEATVRKMKKPFGAPFPDEDIAAMVDYLAKTYGAERASVPGRPQRTP